MVAVSPWKRDRQGLCYAGVGSGPGVQLGLLKNFNQLDEVSEFQFYVVCHVVSVIKLNFVFTPPPFTLLPHQPPPPLTTHLVRLSVWVIIVPPVWSLMFSPCYATPASSSARWPPTTFVSWNVKGLNHPVKRSKVFAHLKKLKADIVYLQETHLCQRDHTRLERDGFS